MFGNKEKNIYCGVLGCGLMNEEEVIYGPDEKVRYLRIKKKKFPAPLEKSLKESREIFNALFSIYKNIENG